MEYLSYLEGRFLEKRRASAKLRHFKNPSLCNVHTLWRTFEKQNGDVFGLLKADSVDSENDPLRRSYERKKIFVEQKSHLNAR